MFKGFPNQKSKMSQGEEGEGSEVHHGLPCGRQKNCASQFSWKMNITSNYIFKKVSANPTGANDGAGRWVVSNDALKICQKWTCDFPRDAKVRFRLRSVPDNARKKIYSKHVSDFSSFCLDCV